jgi:hypothetical protein
MAPRALPRCWVHLAGVSGGVKLHLGSIIIIKINPALSVTIGGQDGMDGSRRVWMTCSIYRKCHLISRRLGIVLAVGRFFHRHVYIYE